MTKEIEQAIAVLEAHVSMMKLAYEYETVDPLLAKTEQALTALRSLQERRVDLVAVKLDCVKHMIDSYRTDGHEYENSIVLGTVDYLAAQGYLTAEGESDE